MKAKILSKKYILIFLALALILTLSLTSSFTLSTKAEEPAMIANVGISVLAKDGGGNTINGIQGTYQGATSFQYNWQDVQTLNINYTPSGAIVPNADGKFTYSLRVRYLKSYIADSETFDTTHTFTKELASNVTVSNLNEIQNIVFAVDPNSENIGSIGWIDIDGKSSECKGWGIYQFEMDINASTGTSDFIGLLPTKITQAPQISYKVVSSDLGLKDAFEFSIIDDEKGSFRYIDEDTIKWYVKGESTDGKLYVLEQGDEERFGENYNNFIRKDPDRTGRKFLFDSNQIDGTWEVFCILTPHNETTELQSNVERVMTGNKISKMTIIWILIAAGIVLLGLIIFIIIKTTKKEKVW